MGSDILNIHGPSNSFIHVVTGLKLKAYLIVTVLNLKKNKRAFKQQSEKTAHYIGVFFEIGKIKNPNFFGNKWIKVNLK